MSDTLDALQRVVGHWVVRYIGPDLLIDRRERALRVLEEAIELAQAEGLSRDSVARLSDRAFSRPAGEPRSEAAGVLVTLLAWAVGAQVSLWDEAIREVRRIHRLPPEAVRLKQAEKARAGCAVSSTESNRGTHD